jgi:hypothetical protein
MKSGFCLMEERRMFSGKIEGEEHGYYFVGEAFVHGFMEGEIF